MFSSLNVGNLQGKKKYDRTGLTKPNDYAGEIKLLSKSRFLLNMIKAKKS